MYEFIDVTEQQMLPVLPAEAMQFGGKWLEVEIPGYRTLYVFGRETISADITDTAVGAADGSLYERKRYEPRTLLVGYQLIAKSNEEFRAAFNRLNGILDAEQVQIVFNDELDKFYVGTKTKLGDIPTGTNAVTGEIEIYCADPFKYSVHEFTAKPGEDGVIDVPYNGTYPAYPVMEATMHSDMGYLSFIHNDGAVLLAGDQEEIDGESYSNASETLIYSKFASGRGTWKFNQATLIGEISQIGTVEVQSTAKGTGITGDSYGTGSGWHGPGLSKELPADSTGHIGAVNCSYTWMHYFGAWSANELGMAQFVMVMKDSDGNKKPLAGLVFAKTARGSSNATVKLYIGEQVMKTITYKCNSESTVSGADAPNPKIEKFGGEFRFTVGGKTYQYSDSTYEEAEAIEACFFFGQWKTNTVLVRNTVTHLRFTAHNVEGWEDIPNKFADEDIVTIDCNAGDILVNGESSPGLGALGNNWESFQLRPGSNRISCYYSDWGERPDIMIRYREVYV